MIFFIVKKAFFNLHTWEKNITFWFRDNFYKKFIIYKKNYDNKIYQLYIKIIREKILFSVF